MRRLTAFVLVLFVVSCAVDLGCSRRRRRMQREQQTPPVVQPSKPTQPEPVKPNPAQEKPTPSEPTHSDLAPAQPSAPIKPVEPTKPAEPAAIVDNPTTSAGRGAPDLEDPARPAAWLYIDGYAGHFIDKDGRPQIQWIVEEPVVTQPTLRLEVYKPLLGTPTTVRLFLQDVPDEETGEFAGPPIRYAFASEEGAFQIGREYELCNLGEDFIIRKDPKTADEMIVERIPPLPPGPYLIAAAIEVENAKEQRGLAITYFTVDVEE